MSTLIRNAGQKLVENRVLAGYHFSQKLKYKCITFHDITFASLSTQGSVRQRFHPLPWMNARPWGTHPLVPSTGQGNPILDRVKSSLDLSLIGIFNHSLSGPSPRGSQFYVREPNKRENAPWQHSPWDIELWFNEGHLEIFLNNSSFSCIFSIHDQIMNCCMNV